MSNTIRKRLRTLQLQIYRKIIGTFVLPGERRQEYYQRTAAIARRYMQTLKVPEWHVLADRFNWRWIGHIARGRQYPRRMLDEMLNLPVRNPTTFVTRTARPDWQILAENISTWNDKFEERRTCGLEQEHHGMITRSRRRTEVNRDIER